MIGLDKKLAIIKSTLETKNIQRFIYVQIPIIVY